jgi:ABC-2 type transport system ATP-binding protein
LGQIINVSELKKVYGDMVAVDNVSIQIQDGEIFGILGPNGAGKTTTLEMIEGLRKPDGGSITIAGFPVWPNPNKVKTLIGVQLQTTALMEYLNVKELVKLFASFYGIKMTNTDANKLLDEVSLVEKSKSMVNQLSGGQQQRLSIALALVNDPKVVFLDEPTTGLDPQARRKLWSVAQRINGEGKTVVITTHYMEEAEVLCNRIAIMDHGKIIALDTPEGLIRSLGADARISFTSQQPINVDVLSAIPAVAEATATNDGYMFYTSDVQKSIVGVLDFAEKASVKVENLSVDGANLEDVFLHMTGRGLRE